MAKPAMEPVAIFITREEPGLPTPEQERSLALGKLQGIKEGDGTLLDNCMIMYGSGLGDGNAHTHDDLPIVVAGRGGRTMQTGRCVVAKEERPLNDLFLSMLDRLDAEVESIGDSKQRLTEIDA